MTAADPRGGLHAPTPSRQTNNFDLIRLFGALQVAFWHAAFHLGLTSSLPAALSWLINRFPGVPIFFVVSGFLVTASLERSSSLSHYARNRVLRIYPGLWVCFLFTLVVLGWLGALTHSFLASTFGPWVAAQLTIAQFFNPAALRWVGTGVINGSLWTIPVELGFYLTLPVLWCMRQRRDFSAVLVITAVLSYLVWALTASPETGMGKLLWVTPVPHLWMFLCGVVAQLHKDRILPLVRGRAAVWIGAYLVLSFLVERAPVLVTGLTYAVLAMAVLSAAYTMPSAAESILRGQDISYGVYIYHMVLVNLALAVGLPKDWFALIAVLAVSVLLASASWRFVEHPALRLKRRAPAARGTGQPAPIISLGDGAFDEP